MIEQAPDLARIELENGPLFAGLDPNRKTGLGALARTAEADAHTRAALAAEQTEAQRRAALLRAGIDSGETTRLAVESAFTEGIIGEDAHRDLTQALEERDSRARAKLDNAAAVANKLAAEGTGLEDEEFDTQTIKDYYETLAPSLMPLPPEERARVEDDLVVKLGIIPVPIINTLRAGILSGKPEQEVAASHRIAAYARQNPALIEAIPEAEFARALAVTDYANLGLPAARAVELASEHGVQKVSAGGADTEADEAPLDLSGQLGGGGELIDPQEILDVLKQEGLDLESAGIADEDQLIRVAGRRLDPAKVLQALKSLKSLLDRKLKRSQGKDPSSDQPFRLPPIPVPRKKTGEVKEEKSSSSLSADEVKRAKPDDDAVFEKTPGGNVFVRGKNGSSQLGKAPRFVENEKGNDELSIKLRRRDFDHIDTPAKRKDAREAGYQDGWDLTLDVADNWKEIRIGEKGRLVLVKPNGHNKIAVLEVAKDRNSDFYRIVTTGFRREEQLGEILWRRERTPGTDAD